jgi:mannose-6-phosphate isomerase-like protein (cupin superfamily)
MKKQYNNILVRKPWGYEYKIHENKIAATWYLNINKNHKTSLHCHPLKKTGFILLNGKVEIELGFYEKVILKSPAKLMIRPGLFHSTKALSKTAKILEIETPVNKNDLVRFRDQYGRKEKPYEGKKKMEQLHNKFIKFKTPKINCSNKYFLDNCKITIEKISKIKKHNNNTIVAVLAGDLVDKKKRSVLSPGDIVYYRTVNKLAKTFNINKELTILTINKKIEK